MGTPRGNQENTKRVHTTRAKGSNFLQVKGKESFIKIESVTAEILMTLSLCGWWWGGGVMCKAIFMSNPTKVMLG